MDLFQKIKKACGSQANLAKSLGIGQMAISQWKRRGQIPVARVLDIERATGGQVTRYEMRPDIYPIERVSEKAA